MIEGTESKDYSILAPEMGQIEESETISKLKKIKNVNSEQERIEKNVISRNVADSMIYKISISLNAIT